MNNHTYVKGREASYLLALVVVVLICGMATAVYFFNNDDIKIHWMVPAALVVMSIFLPLTAISFLSYRLPQKHKEFQDLLKALQYKNSDNDGDAGEAASFILNIDFRGIDYLLPVIFNTLFSILGFYILFANNGLVVFHAMEWVGAGLSSSNANLTQLYAELLSTRQNGSNVTALDFKIYRQSLVAMGFAFLGAYMWSIQYIFRRMVTLDLPPGAYYSVGTRLVYSSFLALIFSHLIYGHTEAGLVSLLDLEGKLPLIAFLAGLFPERLLNWMRDSVSNIVGDRKEQADACPLEMIEGISSFHKARLAELGIDNMQNLAHASLIELIVKTPYKPRVIADWMAQARLCLEFKEHTAAIRKAGVRSILDFQDVVNSEDGSLDILARESGLSIDLLTAVKCANESEQSIDRLRAAYDRLSAV